MPLGIFHYQLLTRVLEDIHFMNDEAELADTVLSGVSQALNAEAGSIFKLEPSGNIAVLAAYGAPLETLKKVKFEIGKGVVGWVAHYAQPVKVDNPRTDKRFLGVIDTATGFKTKSILAAPILCRGRPTGIIEFMNRRDGPFAAADLELISMVGREIGIAFENVALIHKFEEAQRLQESILSGLSAGVIAVDPEGRILKLNAIAVDSLGLEARVAERHLPAVREVLMGHPEILRALAEVGAAETPVLRGKLKISLSGRPAVLSYSGIPLKGKEGQRLGSALVFQVLKTKKGS